MIRNFPEIQNMFWTAAIFMMITTSITATTSTTEIEKENIELPNFNEARSEVGVNGALALQLFEYLLYQYKTKSDSIQDRVSRMLSRVLPRATHVREKGENNFDGLAITTGVVLFVVVIARVVPSIIDAGTQFLARKSETGYQFDSDQFLHLTETVLQSIDKFQKKINGY